MFTSDLMKAAFTAAKAYMATHSKEIASVGVGVVKNLGATAIVAVPYTLPGMVSGAVGGTIAHVTCDDQQKRTARGAVIGGVGGVVTGALAAGPLGAVTNGAIGAVTGRLIGHHEF